jgi:glucuronate isomerase
LIIIAQFFKNASPFFDFLKLFSSRRRMDGIGAGHPIAETMGGDGMEADFLLDTGTARRLYHNIAAPLPIVDYHCHLDPQQLWEDRRFDDLGQLWLEADHYKWRLMRANGVPERLITGDAPWRDKFQAFAETLPRAVGNPLQHWCQLELHTYFGCDLTLNGRTAQTIWDLCRQQLRDDPGLSARGLLMRSHVELVGTTDDPCSDLCYHALLAKDDRFPVRVLPTFRPDPALEPCKPGFAAYVRQLSDTVGGPITTATEMAQVLSARMAFFDDHGCRAADHGLTALPCRPVSAEAATAALQKALRGVPLTDAEREGYQTFLLLHCGREYHRLGWVLQLHFGCLRDANCRMAAQLGPDTGFDVMAADHNCRAAQGLLDLLDRDGHLPRTILYSLDPADNGWIDCLLGAFSGPDCPGKVQHGSAWWFNDHLPGMTAHLEGLASQSILGNFVGMLTDSRSFLSFVRHDYFRRILCGLLGRWAEQGLCDSASLGPLVADICYRNAKRYFALEDLS